MAAISQPTHSNTFTWMKTFVFFIQISLKFVPNGPIDNKPALVQVMAWRWTGDKPLPEPVLTQFTDIYVALEGVELTRAAFTAEHPYNMVLYNTISHRTCVGHRSDFEPSMIARFIRPTWGTPGADRTQVGPCWPHESCYVGYLACKSEMELFMGSIWYKMTVL